MDKETSCIFENTKTNDTMTSTTIIRDTEFSFIQTTTIGDKSFSRKIEKTNVEYGNCCGAFHRLGVTIQIGATVKF